MAVNIFLTYYMGRDFYNSTFSVWLILLCYLILCFIHIQTHTGRILAVIFVRMFIGPLNVEDYHLDTGEWIIASGCVVSPLTLISTLVIFPITCRLHNPVTNLWSALGVLVAFKYVVAAGIGDVWAWACLVLLIFLCHDRTSPSINIQWRRKCPIPCHGHLTESQIDTLLHKPGEFPGNLVDSVKSVCCQRRDRQRRRSELSAYSDNVKLLIIQS